MRLFQLKFCDVRLPVYSLLDFVLAFRIIVHIGMQGYGEIPCFSGLEDIGNVDKKKLEGNLLPATVFEVVKGKVFARGGFGLGVIGYGQLNVFGAQGVN